MVSETLGKEAELLALVFLLILFLELEFVREELRKTSFFHRLLGRKEEKSVASFFLIEAIICLALFDFKIAIVTILMITFGDLSSSLIGRKFGGRDYQRKDFYKESYLNLLLI